MITLDTPIEFNDNLPIEVDVVVIGGGAIGMFSALNMQRKGLNVAVLEKGRIAGEQSSRNWGWIRQHGRDPAELPIMMEASQLWEAFDKEVKGRTGFKRQGVLYLTQTEAKQASREAWISIAKEHGLNTIAVTKKDLDKYIKCDPVNKNFWYGAVHTASDARAEPWQAIPAIAELTQSEGVTIRENCAVRALDIQAGQITGVVTEAGRINCSQVVLAGGAWSSLFLRRHGINIPQLSVQADVARTEPVDDIAIHNSADQGLAWRRRNDGGYTLALTDYEGYFIGPDSFRLLPKWLKTGFQSRHELNVFFRQYKNSPDAWNTKRKWNSDEVTPFEKMRILDPNPLSAKTELMQQRFAERFPQIGKPKILTAWAGMIDAMPDMVPIIDRVPTHEGLIIATGMSGHGFGIAPGFGKIIAKMACGEDSKHDLKRFRFNRFTDGSRLDIGPNI